MTDHRINLTLYRIDAIMDGDLDELTERLAAEHQAELLAALGDAVVSDESAVGGQLTVGDLLSRSTLPMPSKRALCLHINSVSRASD